jgi:hypothetical protein
MGMKEKRIIGEDNICPVAGNLCDDECCPPGAECNMGDDTCLPPMKETVEQAVERLYPNIISSGTGAVDNAKEINEVNRIHREVFFAAIKWKEEQEKSGIDFKEIERRLDEALETETPESLKAFIEKHRIGEQCEGPAMDEYIDGISGGHEAAKSLAIEFTDYCFDQAGMEVDNLEELFNKFMESRGNG